MRGPLSSLGCSTARFPVNSAARSAPIAGSLRPGRVTGPLSRPWRRAGKRAVLQACPTPRLSRSNGVRARRGAGRQTLLSTHSIGAIPPYGVAHWRSRLGFQTQDPRCQIPNSSPQFPSAGCIPAQARRGQARCWAHSIRLAGRIGTTQSAIARLESGTITPTVETLSSLADLVGLRFEIAPDSGLTAHDIRDRKPTLQDLRARRHEILRIAATRGARNVRVFGSVARGNADAASDVDIAPTRAAEGQHPLWDPSGGWTSSRTLVGSRSLGSLRISVGHSRR